MTDFNDSGMWPDLSLGDFDFDLAADVEFNDAALDGLEGIDIANDLEIEIPDFSDMALTDDTIRSLMGSGQSMPSPGRVIREAKRQMRASMRKMAAENLVTDFPAPGWSHHYISGARHDFFDVVPVLVRHLRAAGMERIALTGSTWILNRHTVAELFRLYDERLISRFAILSGDYFQRRSADVYATLLEGTLWRGQHFATGANHAKVILLGPDTTPPDAPPDAPAKGKTRAGKSAPSRTRPKARAADHDAPEGTPPLPNGAPCPHIVIEGSANFCNNSNIEQYVVSNDPALYAFHLEWMMSLASKNDKRPGR